MFRFTSVQPPPFGYIAVTGFSNSGTIIGDMGVRGLEVGDASFILSISDGHIDLFAGSGSPYRIPGQSIPFDVNDNGQVVGEYLQFRYSGFLDGYHWAGYLYSGGTLTDLDVYFDHGYNGYTPRGINSSGIIAGAFGDFSGVHAFIRAADGTSNTFDVPAAWGGHDTEFVDINDNAQVLGTYFDSGNVERSFEYNTITGDYAQLIYAGDQTVLTKINDAGQAIGSYTDGSGVSHGLLFDGNSFTVMDDPLATPGTMTLADINNRGQIVGTYHNSSGSHGFLYSAGSYQTIDDPSGVGSTTVDAINDYGQIAGTYLASAVKLGSAAFAFYAIPNVPCDLNGDSVSDLVFQNNGAPGIWLWDGTKPTAEIGLPNPGPSWHIITSRDVNGDGMADLIWQNSDGTPGIWLMNGTTPFVEAGLTNPGSAWKVVAAGDFNGDSRADLLWQDTSGALGVWEMNGTRPITEAVIGSPGQTWKVIGTADYNADGRDDILLQNTASGNLMLDLMNGTTIASSVSIAVGDPSWHAVSTGVFNGVPEIAWQNSNGTVGIWLMNGTTPVAETALPNPGAGWQLVSIDHFTPDGQPDLLFQNTSGAMMLWEMNGTSIAAQVNLPNPGADWRLVNGHPFAATGGA